MESVALNSKPIKSIRAYCKNLFRLFPEVVRNILQQKNVSAERTAITRICLNQNITYEIIAQTVRENEIVQYQW